MLEVNIDGLAEIQAMLDRLPADIEKKLMRGALRAGQRVVLDQAKSNIRNVSGALAKSLRISTSARGGVVRAKVKAGSKKAYYSHMVEFGTASHYIQAKKAQALAIGGHEVAKVLHPGAKKHPFMRPALDANASDGSAAFQAVAAYLVPRINEQLSQLPDETDQTTS